ncbi:hypothetical protein LTR36_005951 [Oleoguttula mirabilis]|uniref:SH3 domain-containing protein n=1 Tax=Oleoguttula mirabilis TaxID=1507867 RepID=A0AAV9JDQ9_9PEZI|nr:hypothetical protein LTR36_005951 [Oleoguttula mirabilis]
MGAAEPDQLHWLDKEIAFWVHYYTTKASLTDGLSGEESARAENWRELERHRGRGEGSAWNGAGMPTSSSADIGGSSSDADAGLARGSGRGGEVESSLQSGLEGMEIKESGRKPTASLPGSSYWGPPAPTQKCAAAAAQSAVLRPADPGVTSGIRPPSQPTQRDFGGGTVGCWSQAQMGTGLTTTTMRQPMGLAQPSLLARDAAAVRGRWEEEEAHPAEMRPLGRGSMTGLLAASASFEEDGRAGEEEPYYHLPASLLDDDDDDDDAEEENVDAEESDDEDDDNNAEEEEDSEEEKDYRTARLVAPQGWSARRGWVPPPVSAAQFAAGLRSARSLDPPADADEMQEQQQQVAIQPGTTLTGTTLIATRDFMDDVKAGDGVKVLVAKAAGVDGWLLGSVLRTGVRTMIPENYLRRPFGTELQTSRESEDDVFVDDVASWRRGLL